MDFLLPISLVLSGASVVIGLIVLNKLKVRNFTDLGSMSILKPGENATDLAPASVPVVGKTQLGSLSVNLDTNLKTATKLDSVSAEKTQLGSLSVNLDANLKTATKLDSASASPTLGAKDLSDLASMSDISSGVSKLDSASASPTLGAKDLSDLASMSDISSGVSKLDSASASPTLGAKDLSDLASMSDISSGVSKLDSASASPTLGAKDLSDLASMSDISSDVSKLVPLSNDSPTALSKDITEQAMSDINPIADKLNFELPDKNNTNLPLIITDKNPLDKDPGDIVFNSKTLELFIKVNNSWRKFKPE